MASKYLQQYPVPAEFPSVLRDLTREILRFQPKNIVEFSAHYFKCRLSNNAFTWELSKSRGPRPCDYPKIERPPPTKVMETTQKPVPFVPKKKTVDAAANPEPHHSHHNALQDKQPVHKAPHEEHPHEGHLAKGRQEEHKVLEHKTEATHVEHKIEGFHVEQKAGIAHVGQKIDAVHFEHKTEVTHEEHKTEEVHEVHKVNASHIENRTEESHGGHHGEKMHEGHEEVKTEAPTRKHETSFHSHKSSNPGDTSNRDHMNISGTVSLPSNPEDAADQYVDHLIERAEADIKAA